MQIYNANYYTVLLHYILKVSIIYKCAFFERDSWKRFIARKHVLLVENAFSIEIASSFTISPRESINRGLLRSTMTYARMHRPSFSHPPLFSPIVLSSFVFVVSADQATTTHSLASVEVNFPPSSFSCRADWIDESGPAFVSYCTKLPEGAKFSKIVRVNTREKK